MGASTSKYRRCKQGNKLNMTHVAEEMGFPQGLVQLRHAIVHKSSRDGSLLSESVC